MDGPAPDDRRLANVQAALRFLQLDPRGPALALLHRWLDCWRGIGLCALDASIVGLSPRTIRSRRYGWIFWLRRNRFVGSYVRLSARSRSYFASP
jgi:hypothetical protein